MAFIALLACSPVLMAQELPAPIQTAQAPASAEEPQVDPEPQREPEVVRGSGNVSFSIGISGLVGGGLLLLSSDDSATSGTGTTGTR